MKLKSLGPGHGDAACGTCFVMTRLDLPIDKYHDMHSFCITLTTFSSKEKSFIESQRVMRFNSLTPAGKIHSVPICYVYDGTNLYAHANNKKNRRWRNMARNKTASVELDSYSDDWSKLKGVLIDIKPSFVDAGPDQKKALALLRSKYRQYRTMLDDTTPVVKMEPSHVVSWGLD